MLVLSRDVTLSWDVAKPRDMRVVSRDVSALVRGVVARGEEVW